MAKQHFLKDVSSVAEDLASRSKKLYENARERIPEGSEPLIGVAVGGLVVAAGAYFLGRSMAGEKRTLDKPFFRLARLWLIARLVD